MSDTIVALAKKAKYGDKDAFAALMEEVKLQSYKMAYTYVKNEDDALDIVSDSVYKAYKSMHALQNPHYFKTWFMKIVINCAISYLNKNKNIVLQQQDNVSHDLVSEDSDFLSVQKIDLFKALDTLNPDQKTIIILRFYHDYKMEEIAKILDIPLSTVKTRLYKILNILKDQMGEVYCHEI